MPKKTMKDYIKDIQPFHVKNVTIVFHKEKANYNNSLFKKNQNNNIIEKILLKETAVSEFQLQKDIQLSQKILSNQLNRKSKRKFIPERKIDLHGLTKKEALEVLAKVLIQFQSENVKNVLIITGGNSSRNTKIRSSFHRWMQEYFSSYVSSFSPAKISDGGDGAFYVTIKKNNR